MTRLLSGIRLSSFFGTFHFGDDRARGRCVMLVHSILNATISYLTSGVFYTGFLVANDTKYPYVVHAELNAILNAAGRSLAGSRIYVSLFPCNECAKAIIQTGISEVIYLSDKYANTDSTCASKRMLNSAGVKLTQLNCGDLELTLSYKVKS